MATVRSILVAVALLVAAANAQSIVTQPVGSYSLSTGSFNSSVVEPFDLSVVGSSVNIHLTKSVGDATVRLCMQHIFALPDDVSTWSSSSCSIFVEIATNETEYVATVAYLGVSTTVGVYLAAPANLTDFNIDLSLSASACPSGSVANAAGGCSAVKTLEANAPVDVVADAAAVQYFAFSVNQPDTAALVLTLDQLSPPSPSPVAAPVEPVAAPVADPVAAPIATPVADPVAAPVAEPVVADAPFAAVRRAVSSTQSLTVSVRFVASPMFDNSDDYSFTVTSAHTSFAVPAPMVGTWFIGVKRTDGVSSTYNLTAAVTTCPNTTLSGPDCLDSFAPFIGNSSGAAQKKNQTEGSMAIFRIARSTLTGRLVVFASGLRGAKSPANYTLSLAVGGAPTANSMVWTGCSEGPCTFVQAANFSSSLLAAGDLWIGVSGTNANDTVLVWRDSACANDCNKQGTCQSDPSSANFGLCDCQNLFEGADCSVSPTGLPVQVIVLIIIGSLLVLTALVGLIAWIVSRRSSRAGYEAV